MNNYFDKEAIEFEKQYGDECKNTYKDEEIQRKEFLQKFPLDKIKDLSLDEYVIGKGSHDSFCYWLEHILKESGELKGLAGSIKFGIYFSDKEQQYKYAHKKFGDTSEQAFKSVKENIFDLIVAGKEKEYQKIENNKIAPTVKAKILAVYCPDNYLSILSSEHIEYFSNLLEIDNRQLKTIQEKNTAIMNYKNNHKTMKKWDNLMFVRFLYKLREEFGVSSEEEIELALNTATDGTVGYIYSVKLVKERKLNMTIIQNLKELYQGQCQLCGKSNFFEQHGENVVEAHHIKYFSKSQNNDADNIIIVCPNHHRIIHKLNPKFNRDTLSYEYENGFVEKVKCDKHLKK